MERSEKVRQKLKRAKEHILELESSIRMFLDDAYVVATKDKPDIEQTAFYVNEAKDIPASFSLLVGDAVHNLRSALDHLVWQLVEANGETPGRHTAFPIFETFEQTAKNDTAKRLARKIQGVHADAAKAIKSLQPYATKDMTLWHINELDIMDKHQLILTVASCPTHWGLKQQGVWLGELSGLIFDVKVGDELCNFPTSTVEQNENNIDFGFDIAFGDPTMIAGKSVLPTLEGMAGSVDKVISDFHPMLY